MAKVKGAIDPVNETNSSTVTMNPEAPRYNPVSKVNKTIFVVLRTTDQRDGTQDLEVRPLTIEYEWDAMKREVVGFKGEKIKIRPSQSVEGVFD